MRTQINKRKETNNGHNGNGHMAHMYNTRNLNNFLSRLGQQAAPVDVATPEKIKKPEAAYQRSSWITKGAFIVNVPGNRPADAPRFFQGSKWITGGVFTVNVPGNKTAVIAGAHVDKGSSKLDRALKSAWITKGAFTVNVPGNRPADAPRFFQGSKWITGGVFTVNVPGNKTAVIAGAHVDKGSSKLDRALKSAWITKGAFTVNVPGNRPADAPRFFQGSKWITGGVFTVNIKIGVSNAQYPREQQGHTESAEFPFRRFGRDIEGSLRSVKGLVLIKHDRTPLILLKAA